VKRKKQGPEKVLLYSSSLLLRIRMTERKKKKPR
jgi:hypothetical protein